MRAYRLYERAGRVFLRVPRVDDRGVDMGEEHGLSFVEWRGLVCDVVPLLKSGVSDFPWPDELAGVERKKQT